MATTAGSPPPSAVRDLMTMTAGELLFVDTNVLVYSMTAAAPLHVTARTTLDHLSWVGVDIWSSRQIFREYLATLSRPQSFTAPIPITQLAADVGRFSASFRIAEDGPAVTAHLLSLLAAVPCGGKQVHDANIVATMLAHGVPNLLTHNTADFARFGGHVTVVPLVP